MTDDSVLKNGLLYRVGPKHLCEWSISALVMSSENGCHIRGLGGHDKIVILQMFISAILLSDVDQKILNTWPHLFPISNFNMSKFQMVTIIIHALLFVAILLVSVSTIYP